MTPELFTDALWVCLVCAAIGLVWALASLAAIVLNFLKYNPIIGPFAQWPSTGEIKGLLFELAPIIGMIGAFCLTALVASAWLQGASQ
jgi:hypothetical protein